MLLARYIKQDSDTKKVPSNLLFITAELIIVALIGVIVLSYGMFPKHKDPKVLSSVVVKAVLSVTPIPTLAPTVAITPTPQNDTLSPTPVKLPKNAYTIAVFGDSMVDTMGERLEYLEHALKAKYPLTAFTLYNYGIGAQNVEDGLARVGSEFNNRDRHYPILFQTNPDIIIVGSFAYNPFSPYDRDRHWIGLTKLIREMEKISPNIYMLAEIAPLRADFGRGPNGVNWDTSTNYTHSQHIMEQLENAVNLSKSLNEPLIDVYHDTLQKNGEGKKELVNTSDGIHPSVAGHEFMAKKIVDTINFSIIK